MEKVRYRLVWNRRKQLNLDGKALIQIECLLNKRKIYLSTKIYVGPNQWNGKEVINHPLADDYNTMLYNFILDIEKIEIGYWKRGMPVTLSLLKQSLSDNVKPNMTFTEFAKIITQNSKKKRSTKENIGSTIKLLSTYNTCITFEDVNYNFVRRFEDFLKKRGLKINTIAKHLRQLRALDNEAIKAGFIKEYAFKDYKIHQEFPKHTYLTNNEVKKLEDEGTKITDAFLFCVYTGLRYSDFVNLKQESFTKIGGHTWIDIKMIKTGIRVRIPIDMLFEGKAMKLLDKYRLEDFVRIGSDSSVNTEIRKYGERLKIRKGLHWHVARHTFAVLLLERGVALTTVQKLLGHTSVRTTQVYAEITPSTIIKDLRRTKHSR